MCISCRASVCFRPKQNCSVLLFLLAEARALPSLLSSCPVNHDFGKSVLSIVYRSLCVFVQIHERKICKMRSHIESRRTNYEIDDGLLGRYCVSRSSLTASYCYLRKRSKPSKSWKKSSSVLAFELFQTLELCASGTRLASASSCCCRC